MRRKTGAAPNAGALGALVAPPPKREVVEEGVPKSEGAEDAGAEELKPPPPKAETVVCLHVVDTHES